MLSTLFLDRLKALIIAASVFIPFERLAAAHPQQPIFRRGWVVDAVTGLVNGALLYGALMIALGGIDAGAAVAMPQIRHLIDAWPIWAQAIFALVVGDLGVYASHRLAHTVPWLWRFHAVHHSAEEMDWLVGFSFHPIDLLILRIASLGPLVALHVTPAAIVVFVTVSGWQAWLVHANVRIPYGPLRWLVVSPEFHHWHHSAEREAYDKNFASLVASWDVLFRTVHLPPGRQAEHYGIKDPVPSSWSERMIHPFRRGKRAPSPSQDQQIAESASKAPSDDHRRSAPNGYDLRDLGNDRRRPTDVAALSYASEDGIRASMLSRSGVSPQAARIRSHAGDS